MKNRFPHLTMDDGKRFYFGQTLEEAETIFEISGKQHPSILARHFPEQRIIATNKLILTFDAGRLTTMEFSSNFAFNIPLSPYPKDWKNFEATDFISLGANATREEVAKSLRIWEARATKLGATKVEAGEDLSVNEFSFYSQEIEFWNALGINMGESRRAGGGGLWADGWIVQFTTTSEIEMHKGPKAAFYSITAFCDEFNTAARRKK